MILEPFASGNRFYRGNLHGHSNLSDGALSPDAVVSRYKSLGYDFICLSDHLLKDKHFCAEQVSDTRHLQDDDFKIILGAEIHCLGKSYDKHELWHLVANGLPLDFAPAAPEETAPELVSRAMKAGAYVTIAHPEWYCLTMDEAKSVSHAHSVEVYNHSCQIGCDRPSGIAVADYLLNEGHRISFAASDDSHFHEPDYAGGWVMVAAERNDPDLLVEALKLGHHYSSTGAEIYSIALEGDLLKVQCSEAISVSVAGYGESSAAKISDDLSDQAMKSVEIDIAKLRQRSPYFRVTVFGPGGVKAWSNPYWFKDLI